MKMLKWIREFFNPELKEIDPFKDLTKEKTSEMVIKPPKPKTRKSSTKSKSTGGKKNG